MPRRFSKELLHRIRNEVDIRDAPGGAVVRTLTALSAPSASYTAAEQTTDFGAPQGLIHLVVYQLSAVAGRGFPSKASV